MKRTAPKRVHGYRVLRFMFTPAMPATRPGNVILVEIQHEDRTEWCVSWIGVGDREWCQGDYHFTFESAESAFKARCARERRIIASVKRRPRHA